MQERWKPIAGFEGRYEISDHGRVKSLAFLQRYLLRNKQVALRRTKEKLLKLNLINSGYLFVGLWLDNVVSNRLVHVLVAEAFVEGARLETVNHKDGVKTNNHWQNLEWATYTDNHLHAVEMGLNKQAQPIFVGEHLFHSLAQASRHFGVGAGTLKRRIDSDLLFNGMRVRRK